jgi:ribosomal protein S19
MFIIKRVIGLEIGVHNGLWFICVHLVAMCLQHSKSVELKNVNLTKVIF